MPLARRRYRRPQGTDRESFSWAQCCYRLAAEGKIASSSVVGSNGNVYSGACVRTGCGERNAGLTIHVGPNQPLTGNRLDCSQGAFSLTLIAHAQVDGNLNVDGEWLVHCRAAACAFVRPRGVFTCLLPQEWPSSLRHDGSDGNRVRLRNTHLCYAPALPVLPARGLGWDSPLRFRSERFCQPLRKTGEPPRYPRSSASRLSRLPGS